MPCGVSPRTACCRWTTEKPCWLGTWGCAKLSHAAAVEIALDCLAQVTLAVVHGSRATYRLHLTSGSIHVEPGGYLCVVPASFGGAAHHQLFLPFADEDRMTSVILSKVLLLNDDEHIKDPTILAQLPPAR
jgi:hypothetical protein